jgi:hypothetical protein
VPTTRDLLRLSVMPSVLAAIAAALIYAAAGRTLGFYLGPLFAVTLILPPLVTRRIAATHATLIAIAVVDTFAVAWLLAVFGRDLDLRQWLACYVVLAAYGLAILALTRATAAWFALVAGALWLTWPVWTSPFVTINLARWLTPAHPLMAVNVVVRQHGMWLEQRLMYRYSSLGQDVPYLLPASIWPCVIVHAALGVILLSLRPRGRSRAPSSPPAGSSTAPSA